jgi:hypothetical protein
MTVTPFEQLNPSAQRLIVAELLLEYSKWSFEKRETQLYTVVTDSACYGMSYQAACKLAANFIMEDNMKARKFEMFIKRLREKAIENVYEFLMGESIERALK